MRNAVGNVLLLIRELNDLEWTIEIEGESDERRADQLQLTALLDNAFNVLPGMQYLSIIDLVPDPDSFFEILCMHIKNSLLSFQGWLKKLETCKLNVLQKQINLLRSDFTVNSADIFNLEREYSSILEKKLVSKVSGMKIFENLNSEKPTPAFLTLAKNKTEGKLSLIRDCNNLEFASEIEINTHIFDEYAKIYNPDPSPPLRDDIIHQFLGPEICNSDLVRNSKLKQDEKDWLDRPLS
jgi:hypothetical protein